MAVSEKTLTPAAMPVHSKCFGTHHCFSQENPPPGTICRCGQKVAIYEPCSGCQQMTRALVDVKKLEEDYHA